MIKKNKFTINNFKLKKHIMADISIRPLGARVIIEAQAAETETASGIIIPDSAKEKPQQGTVVATGSGTKDEKMELQVGDLVLYGKYIGTEISHNGSDYLIINQNEVLAIL